MRIKKLYILLLVLTTPLFSEMVAQNLFPDNGFLYDHTNVARVDVTISPDYLDMILLPGNEESDYEYPAIFSFKRGATSSTIDSIGFRLRGNTSRNSKKKSFKVSLNSFIAGQKYHGVEKINLNGEHNDPSISRAHISWELFRRVGVPAPRSGHAELYINDEYKGLYINVEHIDEEFVNLRFGNNDGNLYKCLWPADMRYISANADDYKFEQSGRRAYELKTNLLQDDYSDIAELIEVLHTTDPSDFPQYFEPLFNVNSYLKNLVVEVLIGHWDAYSYNKNNFYLYHNESTDKFEFIPYDSDNTLGISWEDIDWAERDIYNWSSSPESRPLTAKILQNETYRARYSFYMNRFLAAEFNSAKLDPMIEGIKSQIQSFAENDLYRTYDYEYSFDDFLNSFDQIIGAHAREGIIPFISKRNSSALDQLNLSDIAPAISVMSINKPVINSDLEISALVEDELPLSEIRAYFSDGGEFTAYDMIAAGRDLYTVSYPGLSEIGLVSFYIEATDQLAQTTREPPFGTYDVNFGPVSATSSMIQQHAGIKIYPNPARISFTVETRRYADKYNYKLYNLSGQAVSVGSSEKAEFTIQIDDRISDGLYYLEVGFEENGSPIHFSHSKVLILK